MEPKDVKMTYQTKRAKEKLAMQSLKRSKRNDKIGAYGLLVGILLIFSSADAFALEPIPHPPIDDGTGTTITWEGERVEK